MRAVLINKGLVCPWHDAERWEAPVCQPRSENEEAVLHLASMIYLYRFTILGNPYGDGGRYMPGRA